MFHFGAALHLDAYLTIYSFCAVIAFLVFFDYVTGVLEYFLEKSHLHLRMLQMMYKELMLMGLVSFTFIMYSAIENEHSEFLITLDFAHVILFFVTLFFVVHSFFLMGMSIFNEKKYQRMYGEDLQNLIDQIEKLSENSVWKFFYESEWWPFSSVRRKTEFHLLNTLFHNTYLLSESFDFANYISFSFGRYALKTINRSLFSWIVLLIILVVNFARNVVGLGCIHEDHAPSDDRLINNYNCPSYTVRTFVLAGFCFVSYMTVMVFVSHLYQRRLLKFGGVREPSEYLNFLIHRKEQQEEHKTNKHYDHHERFHNHELKEEIEFEMHSSEHAGEEEEPEIKFIATSLIKLSKYLSESYATIKFNVRLFFVGIFCQERLEQKKSRKSSILSMNALSNISEPLHRMSRMSFAQPFQRITRMGRQSNASPNSLNAFPPSSRPSKARASVLQRTSQFIHNSAEAIRHTKLPSFHHFRSMNHEDVHKIPLKDRLTFKFAKNAPHRQTNLTSFHLQDRNRISGIGGLGSESVDPLLSPSVGSSPRSLYSNKSASGNFLSPRKESEVRLPSQLAQLNIKEEEQEDDEDEDDDEEENRKPNNSSNKKTDIGSDSNRVDSSSATNSNNWSFGNCWKNFRYISSAFKKVSPDENSVARKKNDDSKMSVHQNEIDELQKFKSTAVSMEHEFHSIFLFNHPVYYIRAVELCILFNCLYMAFWATNMITIIDHAHYTKFWFGLMEFLMILPIVWGFFCISIVSETCSMIIAISDLNLIVVHDVICQMEETEAIVKEVRLQFMYIYQLQSNSRQGKGKITTDEYVKQLFLEIDEDGSGFIDADELRNLLKKLHITFSNHRFNLLYRAMDSSFSGSISEAAFKEFVFPAEGGVDLSELEKGRSHFSGFHPQQKPQNFSSPPPSTGPAASVGGHKPSLIANHRGPFGVVNDMQPTQSDTSHDIARIEENEEGEEDDEEEDGNPKNNDSGQILNRIRGFQSFDEKENEQEDDHENLLLQPPAEKHDQVIELE